MLWTGPSNTNSLPGLEEFIPSEAEGNQQPRNGRRGWLPGLDSNQQPFG